MSDFEPTVTKRNPVFVAVGFIIILLQYGVWGILLTLRRILCLPIALEHACVKACAHVILFCLHTTVRIKNREIYNDKEAAIVIANHSSYSDIPATQAACSSRLRMLAKKELFYVPLLGWAMWAAHYVGVSRGKKSSGSKATRTLAKRLEAGYQIFLAPEGTRSPDGRLLPFKQGAFRMAAQHQVPIYVLALSKPWKLWPKSSYFPCNKGEIEAKFLGKIEPKNRENLAKTADEMLSEAKKLYLQDGFVEC